jgi:hypothetical protein
MRKVAIGVAVWMVLMIAGALYYSGHSGSPQPTTQTTAVAGTLQPDQTTTAGQSQAPPANSHIAPVAPPGSLNGNVPPALGAANAADAQRIQLATSGWPSLAKMPWHGKGVVVDYLGLINGVVVLSVDYSGNAGLARTRAEAFLIGNNDNPKKYQLRLLSQAQKAAQHKIADAHDLFSQGYHAVAYLPETHGQTTVSFAGVVSGHPTLLVRYRGKLAQAQRDAKFVVNDLNDTITHYRLRYQKG